MSLESMAERTAELFARCFGHAPRWIVAAPGRVNVIGEHTDYNDGFVLPMAIERYTVIAGDRNDSREVTLHSVTTGETATFNVREPLTRGEPSWSNYVRGVVAGFQQRPIKVPGFDAVIASTVPFGGGLSSSAALEVATATLLEAITGEKLEPIEKALLCQKAEHEFAGVPCGIMDQFTSILARENHALLLDCRSRTTIPVAMTDPSITVLMINTNVRHKLADGEYAKRRSQCQTAASALKVPFLRDASAKALKAGRSKMEPIAFRRARHVISENERTREAAWAIQAADWATVGRLMYASHDSLRDDYEVSCQELDVMVDLAKPIRGVFGARMTGGGFGGCTINLVAVEAVGEFTQTIRNGYAQATGKKSGVFICSAADGAERVQ